MVKSFTYRTIILTIVLISLQTILYAQFEKNYTPVKYSWPEKRISKNEYFKRNTFEFESMSSDEKDKFEKYLYSLFLAYCNVSEKEFFISDEYVDIYFKNILTKILTANNITTHIEVVVTRSSSPNAYNIGDNKLYINIGLIKLIQNESQLAFILSHELSHQLLFHVQKSFIASEKKKNDLTYKKEVNEINNAKFNKLDRAFALTKNMEYEFARYSRANECSADSMALILLSKTEYDMKSAEGVLKILEHCDEDTTTINYKKYFESSQFVWNNNWTKSYPSRIDFGDKDIVEINADSLKTHPDIPYRINMAKNELASNKFAPTNRIINIQSSTLFDSIKTMAMFEEIEYYNKAERYGATLFHAMSLMNRFPKNTYLLEKAQGGLDNIIESITSHKIQDHIPIISEELPPAYNQLLNLIGALSIQELKTLQTNFKNYVQALNLPHETSSDK